MADAIGKFQQLLRELFQFDCADLDFGIYRIMNYKREVIEKFIQKKLPDAIADELERGGLEQQDRAAAALEKARQDIIKNLGADAIDDGGELAAAYRNFPIGRNYLNARARAAGSRSRAAVETDIYNHLYAFFSRYYQDGDFISKRRYSKHQRYAIPYNGEEVYLHWANSDQYYIKTGEHFRDYDWKVPNGVAVHFRLKAADVEQNNVKGDKRFFLPRAEETKWDADARAITIPFEYRPLTETEIKNYGKQKQQDKIIAEAVDAIPKQLDKVADALAALTGERHESVSHLEHHLRQYTRRNTSDFFIHKNLAEFLSRELDFYLKSEVLNLDEMTAAGEHIAEGWFQVLQLIKLVGDQVIAFLAQMENFQKMLWEKRKFVTETQYCITLGNIDERFYPDIAACEPQWTEWKELFHIDEEETNLFNSGKDKNGKRIAFLQEHPTLVLDTAHFGCDFVDEMLTSFDDIDGLLDGLLVHSENWQALNLLAEKYRERVKCVYIDPPYNTDASPILYKNGYKSSTWVSLLDNRLQISRRFLTESGVLVAAIDDEQHRELSFLLSGTFDNQLLGTILVRTNPSGRPTKSGYSVAHEYLLCAGQGPKSAIGRMPPTKKQMARFSRRDKGEVFEWRNLRREGSNSDRSARPALYYPIYIGGGESIRIPKMTWNEAAEEWIVEEEPRTGEQIVFPDNGNGVQKTWRWEWKTVMNSLADLSVRKDQSGQDYVYYKRRFNKEGVVSMSCWFDAKYSAVEHGTTPLKDMFGESVFPHPKSIHAVVDSIYIAGGQQGDARILDYFAGSGTTGHAVINLNREDGGQRKFILVEMGEYFDTVLLPRIKKIAFTPQWKDGKPKRDATPEEAERSPRIVKYIRLESYEDALNSIAFDDSAVQLKLEEQFDDYLIKYMLQWETKSSETLLNVAKLASPFTYRLRVHANGETQERMADIPETFNYLLGLSVRTRRVYNDDGRRYLVYRGETRDAPGRDVAVVWRETEGWEQSDFERDRRLVAEQGLVEGADAVYVNGDSFIPNAKAIEPLFKARMFSEVAT